jgi:glycosidase
MYRRLLELRRGSTALRIGSYVSQPASNELILVYRRESDHETVTVALNFSSDYQEVAVGSGTVVFSTHDPDRGEPCGQALKLAPLEGVILAHP